MKIFRFKYTFQILFLIAVALIFNGNLYAQTGRVLNLKEAISIAENNNPDLRIAFFDQMKAEYRVKEAYAENLIPNISMNSTYSRSFKRQVFEIMGQRFEIGSDNTIINTFQVQEPIPVLGTPVFSGIKIAQYYEELQVENVAGIRSKIRADVKKAFYNVLLLKEVIAVNENSIINARENLRVVEARYNAGVALEFDFIRAKVKIDNILPALNQAQNNLVLAKQNLRNILGVSPLENLDVTGKFDYDSVEVWSSTEQLMERIIKNNHAIKQLNIGRLINEELVEIDEASFMPRLYVFGSITTQAQENDDKNIFKYRFFNSINAGVGLNWDLNFIKKNHKLKQSMLEVKKSEEQIRSVVDKVRLQSESILLRMEDARNRVIAQAMNVDQANRGLQLARTGFLSGVVNQIDVLDSELLVSQVQLGYVQAIYDYLVARTELEQLLEK
jgi:outer membrane protein TolC